MSGSGRKYKVGDAVKGGTVVGIPDGRPGVYNVRCDECGFVRIKTPRKTGCRECNKRNGTARKYQPGDVVMAGKIIERSDTPGKFIIECRRCKTRRKVYPTVGQCMTCYKTTRKKYFKGRVLEDGRQIIDVDRSTSSVKVLVACVDCKVPAWKYVQNINTVCIECRYRNKMVDKYGADNPELAKRISDKIKSYKRSAKARTLDWELSSKEASEMFLSECFYCGYKSESLNGIDRVDNSLGYTPANTVGCCTLCNKAKRDLSISVWKDWIVRLVRHQAGG